MDHNTMREHLRELLRDEGRVKYSDTFLDHALGITIALTSRSAMKDIDWSKMGQRSFYKLLNFAVQYIESLDTDQKANKELEFYKKRHTELQARNTELVLENRRLKEKLQS